MLIFIFFNSMSINKIYYDIFTILKDYPIFFYFIILYFFNILISIFLLKYKSLNGIFISNIFFLGLLILIYIFYFFLIIYHNAFYYINLGKWFFLSFNNNVELDFFIDIISISFSLLTLSIALFVNIYMYSYFRFEPLLDRLIILLNLFVLSMVFLVSSSNFINFFLGWELIGLTSYLLINFWSNKTFTLKAAFKAFSYNKVSDLFLLIAIILICNIFNTIDINVFLNSVIFYKNFYINIFSIRFNIIETLIFFFTIPAFIKSAQIGGHIWLPDSMEAPVPASALIHSATLVSAGIFIMLRLNELFQLSGYFYFVITIVGCITALYGSIMALKQFDIKKILAYSTISHCGFLMLLSCTFNIEIVLIYLYIHGYFKASSFLIIGNVIRFSKNNQDLRKMGGYFNYLPFECLSCFICLANLSGLPFSFGYYSKHLLFIIFHDNFIIYNLLISILLLAGLIGLLYSWKLFYYIFFDYKKGFKSIYKINSKNLNKQNSIFNSNFILKFSIACLIIIAYIIIFFLFIYYLVNYIAIEFNSYIYSLNVKLLFLNLLQNSYFNLFFLYLYFIIILFTIFTKYKNKNSNLFLFNYNFFILFIMFFFTLI